MAQALSRVPVEHPAKTTIMARDFPKAAATESFELVTAPTKGFEVVPVLVP
jgi:hypothetical protein